MSHYYDGSQPKHDKVLTGVVERFGCTICEDSYCDVLDDDFSKDYSETLMGMLSLMIGQRVLITIDKYPAADETTTEA